MGMKFVMQVVGGDPLLKLVAVDWFTVDKSADRISLHPKCLVQVISISNVLYLLIFVLIIVKQGWGEDAQFAFDMLIKKT